MGLKIGPQKRSPLTVPVRRCETCGSPSANVLFLGVFVGKEEMITCRKCALAHLLEEEEK